MSDIASVVFYLLVIFFSTIFAKLLSLSYNHNYIGSGRVFGTLFIRVPLFIGTILPLILITTFRYNVGTDYENYEELYVFYSQNNGSIENLFHAGKELGYGLINWIAYHVFHSYEGVKFLSSLCVLIPALYALLKYDKKHFSVGWFLYLLSLYLSSFNGLRQHIAVSLCLLSIVLFYKGKWIKSILLVAVSTQFHLLSLFTLVLFGLFYFSKKRVNIKKFAFHVTIVIIAGLLVGVLLKVFSNISIFRYYLEKYSDTFGAVTMMHFVTHISFKLPLSFIIFLYFDKLIENNKKNYPILLYSFFDYVFVLSSYYLRWAIRMQYYSMIAAPLIIIEIKKMQVSKKTRTIAITLLIISYILRFAIIFGYSKYDAIVPYHFLGR